MHTVIKKLTRFLVLGLLFFLPKEKKIRIDRWLRGKEEFRKLRLADCVIVSFGKSGRTWLRVMLSRFYQLKYGFDQRQRVGGAGDLLVEQAQRVLDRREVDRDPETVEDQSRLLEDVDARAHDASSPHAECVLHSTLILARAGPGVRRPAIRVFIVAVGRIEIHEVAKYGQGIGVLP